MTAVSRRGTSLGRHVACKMEVGVGKWDGPNLGQLAVCG